MSGKGYAIYCCVVLIIACIFLIWYIKRKEKQFIKFLYKYNKSGMVEGDYQFYILNLYIAMYVWEKPIYNFDDYNKLLNKYLKNINFNIDN